MRQSITGRGNMGRAVGIGGGAAPIMSLERAGALALPPFFLGRLACRIAGITRSLLFRQKRKLLLGLLKGNQLLRFFRFGPVFQRKRFSLAGRLGKFFLADLLRGFAFGHAFFARLGDYRPFGGSFGGPLGHFGVVRRAAKLLDDLGLRSAGGALPFMKVVAFQKAHSSSVI